VQRVELKDIFRTDPLGDIARNSEMINRGVLPTHYRHVMPQQLLQSHEQRPSGCIFVPSHDASDAQNTMSTIVLPWLRSVGYDLKKEVQVLAPVKKGPSGTVELNRHLRPVINPELRKNELGSEGDEISVGDLVIQLVNDYTANVLNGESGVVTEKRLEGHSFKFVVKFENEDSSVVEYTRSDLGQRIALAYALTVHKAQGSQYEVICMPVLKEQAFMLDRNLLYTGISRAKRLLVLVGSEDAIAKAVRNKKSHIRRTLLQQRISDDDFAKKVTPWLWLNMEEEELSE